MYNAIGFRACIEWILFECNPKYDLRLNESRCFMYSSQIVEILNSNKVSKMESLGFFLKTILKIFYCNRSFFEAYLALFHHK